MGGYETGFALGCPSWLGPYTAANCGHINMLLQHGKTAAGLWAYG
jgi:hypothetical protein